MPPKITSPVATLATAIKPPKPVNDSIAPLTAPLEPVVVAAAYRAVPATPKRCSLPSRFTPCTLAAICAGVPCASAA